MNQEKEGHRDLEALWGLPGHLESQAEGVVLELMVLEACQDSLDPRETEGLMVLLDFPVKRDTGVNQVPQDPLVLLERMEKGEMMERSDPGDFLVNQGPVVCWDQKDLKDLLDPLVSLDRMDLKDQKETSDLKESQDLPGSREIQEPRGSQVHRERLDLQERRVLQESQVCQECQELMVHQVTLERKGRLVKKDTWVLLVLKALLVTLVLEV